MFALQNIDHVFFNLSCLTAAVPIKIYRKPKKIKEKKNINLQVREIQSASGNASGIETKLLRIAPPFGNVKSRILGKIVSPPAFSHNAQNYLPAAVGLQNGHFQIRTLKIGSRDGWKNQFVSRLRNILAMKQKEEKDSKKTKTIPNKDDSDDVKIAFAEGFLEARKPRSWTKIFQPLITLLAIIGLLFALLTVTTGSVFKTSFRRQLQVNPEDIHVNFDDVKGVDEAKEELRDVVEFLRNPSKFTVLGGKLTKGILLVGPPGTGKTLLARAVAGEAGVPFFHAAGPEFDEILVGQGAKRVRELFKAAKEMAPCVVFIDEIDSIGSKRTNSDLHPYANQTINQLLSEMDGFHQNEGVVILGATNRKEDLDKALLRPGRFDVEVFVPPPDLAGRIDILNLYMKKILHRDVDVDRLARGTTGFTGADLENMVNQAALRAAIDGASCVTTKYLEAARDKILMGPERKSRVLDEETNKITAYHEGGHTLVGYYTKNAYPLHKVTIVPRGHTLGHTAYIPDKEQYHITKAQMIARMDTLMGGRAAEELIFGAEKITSGAASDLKQATMIATKMVKDWGMSERIGVRTLDDKTKSYILVNDFGQITNDLVDFEIKRILQDSYERAKNILKTHAAEHKLLAEALIKYETLDAEEIKLILTEKKFPKKK